MSGHGQWGKSLPGTEIRRRPLQAVPGAAEASAEPSCPGPKEHFSAAPWAPRDPSRKTRPPFRQGPVPLSLGETPSFSNPRPVPAMLPHMARVHKRTASHAVCLQGSMSSSGTCMHQAPATLGTQPGMQSASRNMPL